VKAKLKSKQMRMLRDIIDKYGRDVIRQITDASSREKGVRIKNNWERHCADPELRPYNDNSSIHHCQTCYLQVNRTWCNI
jgi:hypothetical protein